MKIISKTKSIILTALVVFGSLLTACSSDDDNTETKVEEKTIVGTWELKKSVEETFLNDKSEGKTDIPVNNENYTTYTFSDDNKFTEYDVDEYEDGPMTDEGTYKIENNKLTLTYGVDNSDEYTFDLNDDTLILVLNEEESFVNEEGSLINMKYIVTQTYNRQ